MSDKFIHENEVPVSIQEQYLVRDQQPKKYWLIRIYSYLIRAFALVLGFMGVVFLFVPISDQLPNLFLDVSGFSVLVIAFAVFVAGSLIELAADVGTNVHSAAISLKRLEKRRRRVQN